MPFTSISPNFPQPQNLLPPSCPDNFFSLLHLSWLPLLTFDSFVNLSPPHFCQSSATVLFFSQLLEKTVQKSSIPQVTCLLPGILYGSVSVEGDSREPTARGSGEIVMS